MTSTNDGKEVKSNQTSGQKGKTYFIELYKSLEARLSAECTGEQRARLVCEAWRRVHSLCQHSAPTTHPHLLVWLQRHTAHTILQTEWQSPKSKEQHTWLDEAIGIFIGESQDAISKRDGVSPQWESQLLHRAQWFRNVLPNPWGHSVLKALLDSRGTQPTDEEVLTWLKEERGVMFVTRLRQLAASKCDDLALLLAGAVMGRVRACTPLLSDAEQAEDRRDQPEPPQTEQTFADILRKEAGFTVDVWELLTDIEFVLLHKGELRSRCIELAKQTPLRNGYQLVERLYSRLQMSPRDKKLWKNAKEVSTLIAQVVIARCMVVPLCAGACRAALYGCARSLARQTPPAQLRAAAAALAAPAATARHLHTLAAAVHAECKTDIKSFVCELYVRAITAGMNELERLKIKTEKESEARTTEQTLSTWFIQLGSLLSDSLRLSHECLLTAFSVHPSPIMYERVKTAPLLAPLHKDIHEPGPDTNSEFGSWATDSRTQTNLVKTSETLNIKQTQKHANVLSTAIFAEGEALGLCAELCQDLAVLISGPRVKTLSWDMERESLLENCRAYLERTHGGTRALTTELKYLNLDLRSYQHLPEEIDDENDAFYGIEKGYEHLVEYQEPEEIWQDALSDSFDKSDTDSTSESTIIMPRRKKKTKHLKYSSDEETDPLSLEMGSNKMEQKEIHNSKEKTHSKDRNHSKEKPYSKERNNSKDRPHSKERKNKKDKHKTKEIKMEIDPLTDQADNDKAKKEKKKQRKERKKKEKVEAKDLLKQKPQSGALSRLIGMKVARIPDINTTTKRIETNTNHNNNLSITESDYDSQGKSSLTSLNSEGNDPDVLFDGLFSMDEIKSPEKSTDTIQRTYTPKVDELRIGNGIAPKVQKMPILNQRVQSIVQTNDVRNQVKKSIKKLIEFRRNKEFNEELEKIEHSLNYKQPLYSDKPLPANENTYPYKPISEENVISSNAPKIYLNADKVKQLNSFKDKVNNILKKSSSKGNNTDEKATQVRKNVNNKFLHSKILEKDSVLLSKTPVKTYQRQAQPNCYNLEQHIQKPINNSYKNSETPSQEQYKEFLKQRSFSSVKPWHLVNSVVENSSEKNVQNFGVDQTSLQVNRTNPSQSKINLLCHESIDKEYRQLMSKPSNILHESEHNTVDHQNLSQEAATQKLNRSNNSKNLSRKIMSNDNVSPSQNQFQHFLKELQETINAGASKEQPEFNSSLTEKHSTKQLAQQKKVDNAPNTFSRLSYLHKNKQCDSKNKELIDQTKPLLSIPSKDTQRLGGHFDKVTHLKSRSDINISRIDKTKSIANEVASNTKVIVQTVQNFKCLPSSKNTPLCLNRQYPAISNVLSSPCLSNKISEEIENKIIEQKNCASSSSGYLSEQDQKELLVLLRQQSKMHPLKYQQNTEVPNNSIEAVTVQPNVKSNRTKSSDLITEKNNVLTSETTTLPVNLSSTLKISKEKASHSGSELKKVRSVKSKSNSKQTAKTKEKSDWESVMNALLAHKTPSRGPNALDIFLKKDSFEKRSANNQLESQNIKTNLSMNKNADTITKHAKTKLSTAETNKPCNAVACSAVANTENSSDSKQQQEQNQHDKKTDNAPKIELDFNDKNIIDILESDDPFISGIPNSDYDLIEELMDDDLRKEIELISDEDVYNAITASPTPKKNVNSFANDFPNYKINPLPMKQSESFGSCQNMDISLNKNIIISHKPIQDLQSNCNSIQQPIIQTNLTPISNIPNTKPVILSDELIMPTTINQCSKINIVDSAKPCENNSYHVNNACNKQSTEINIRNDDINSFLNLNTTPKVTDVPITNTNNLLDSGQVVLTVPQKQPSVMVIGNDLIYDPFTTIQIAQPAINENVINYENNTYVALNQTPNLTLYRTPQLAAPCVTPIVIDNAVTVPIIQRATPNINILTNLPNKNKVDIPENKTPVKLSNQDQQLKTEKLQLITNKNKSKKIISETSPDTSCTRPVNTTGVEKAANVNKVEIESNIDINKLEVSNNNFIESIIENNQKEKNIKGNTTKVQPPATNFNTELKSLKATNNKEEKKKIRKKDKVVRVSNSKKSKKNQKNTVAALSTDYSSDKERIELKRKRILNRQINHRCFAETIALPYEPIKTLKKRIRLQKIKIKRNKKVKDSNSDKYKINVVAVSVINQTNEIPTDKPCENGNATSASRIVLRSSKSVSPTLYSEVNNKHDIPTDTSKCQDSIKYQSSLSKITPDKSLTIQSLPSSRDQLSDYINIDTTINLTHNTAVHNDKVNDTKYIDIEEQIVSSKISNTHVESVNLLPTNGNDIEMAEETLQNNTPPQSFLDPVVDKTVNQDKYTLQNDSNTNKCANNLKTKTTDMHVIDEIDNASVDINNLIQSTETVNALSKETAEKNKSRYHPNLLRRHTVIQNARDKKNIQSIELNKVKNRSRQSFISRYKNNITFEELPDPTNNPLKKIVRIKLPSGTTFKATISGKLNVNVDTIFEDPAIKALLWKNMNNNTKCTLNIKQVAVTSPSEAQRVTTHVHDIVYPESRFIHDTETIDLVSDDEENNHQIFQTEFGKFDIALMDSDDFVKHQKRLSQKCTVKMERLPFSKAAMSQLKLKVGIDVTKEVPLCADAEIIEIDDSSNDSAVTNFISDCSLNNLDNLTENLGVLKDLLVKDLGFVESPKGDENTIVHGNIDKPLNESSLNFNKTHSEQHLSNIQKCDNLLVKNKIKKCFIHLVRCDDSVKSENNFIADEFTNEDSSVIQNELEKAETVTNDNLHSTLKRSGSLSILTDFCLSNENNLSQKSPSLIENYAMPTLSNGMSTSTIYSKVKSEMKFNFCSSDWLITKLELHHYYNEFNKGVKAIYNSEKKKQMLDDLSTDCDSDNENNTLLKQTEDIVFDSDLVQYKVPSLNKIVLNYVVNNYRSIENLKRISNETVKYSCPLKRKLSIIESNRCRKKITKIQYESNSDDYTKMIPEVKRPTSCTANKNTLDKIVLNMSQVRPLNGSDYLNHQNCSDVQRNLQYLISPIANVNEEVNEVDKTHGLISDNDQNADNVLDKTSTNIINTSDSKLEFSSIINEDNRVHEVCQVNEIRGSKQLHDGIVGNNYSISLNERNVLTNINNDDLLNRKISPIFNLKHNVFNNLDEDYFKRDTNQFALVSGNLSTTMVKNKHHQEEQIKEIFENEGMVKEYDYIINKEESECKPFKNIENKDNQSKKERSEIIKIDINLTDDISKLKTISDQLDVGVNFNSVELSERLAEKADFGIKENRPDINTSTNMCANYEKSSLPPTKNTVQVNDHETTETPGNRELVIGSSVNFIQPLTTFTNYRQIGNTTSIRCTKNSEPINVNNPIISDSASFILTNHMESIESNLGNIGLISSSSSENASQENRKNHLILAESKLKSTIDTVIDSKYITTDDSKSKKNTNVNIDGSHIKNNIHTNEQIKLKEKLEIVQLADRSRFSPDHLNVNLEIEEKQPDSLIANIDSCSIDENSKPKMPLEVINEHHSNHLLLTETHLENLLSTKTFANNNSNADVIINNLLRASESTKNDHVLYEECPNGLLNHLQNNTHPTENEQESVHSNDSQVYLPILKNEFKNSNLQTNTDAIDTLHKNVTLVYNGDANVVLKGSLYEDPIVGKCYVFPISKRASLSDGINVNKINSDTTINLFHALKNRVFEEQPSANEKENSNSLNVVIPKITYSRQKLNFPSSFSAVEDIERKNIKRKHEGLESKFSKKRYRKGKNIDNPKIKAMSESSYSKEYKNLFNYCSSIKFSFSRPFHKEFIDVSNVLKCWPIQGNNIATTDLTEYKSDLFTETNREIRSPYDPLQQTLAEEISSEYIEQQSSGGQINESNFNMGFGEESDRVIKISEDENSISKFSAATLSDVKQSQPFLLSEDYEDCDKNRNINDSKQEQIEMCQRFISLIKLKDKVRSFFKKTTLELNYNFLKDNKNNKCLSSQSENVTFSDDLLSSDFIEPAPIEYMVHVVQVGQLPVSAAAQNPVTCDPRVTQVTDASPSRIEDNAHDDSQSSIKTEYTELTTADLSLPLMQEYERHIKSKESTTVTICNENITVEMEVTEIKTEEEIIIKDEPIDYNEDEYQPLVNNQINNIEYTYVSGNNLSNNQINRNTEVVYEHFDNQNCEFEEHQIEECGSVDSSSQINTNNNNGFDITSSSEPNTNLNADTIPEQSQNIVSKAALNTVSLQQALVQASPPSINQNNVQENNQPSKSSAAPQVLHIVQGKNTNRNHITLVENISNSVSSTNTPVLHIVQNKEVNTNSESNTSVTQHASYNGLPVVDAKHHQGNNQLLHIVNTSNQKNSGTTGQLLKRVNLLTNVTNAQGANEQKMVQFLCKSSDGKSIQLNAPHQRGMVLRLHPIETSNIQEPTEEQDSGHSSNANMTTTKELINGQNEIKSRSVYEENYAKFIQCSNNKSMPEKATSLPKFNQAFGKQVYQDNIQKTDLDSNSSNLSSVNLNLDSSECQSSDNAMNMDHISRISSPPLLIRKPSVLATPASTASAHPNLMHQIKQTITPMNIQTMHGGVIYTRQIPVNIGGGQTINLITVPSTELVDEGNHKHHNNFKFVHQGEIDSPIIKIVPQSQTSTDGSSGENINHSNISNDSSQNTSNQHQPVLTQMRIKLPMLSKAPQMVSGARVVRPSFFQIQRNVIGGANQPVYQQLLLTAAPPLGQHTIRLPQSNTTRNVKLASENQASPESLMSSSTLEQLREFDMVLEQVKERSTVQPSPKVSSTYKRGQSSDTIDSTSITSTVTESTQQVLYSMGSNQSVNMAYVSKKYKTTTKPIHTSFVRSPDSSGIIDSPPTASSTYVQICQSATTDELILSEQQSISQEATSQVSTTDETISQASTSQSSANKVTPSLATTSQVITSPAAANQETTNQTTASQAPTSQVSMNQESAGQESTSQSPASQASSSQDTTSNASTSQASTSQASTSQPSTSQPKAAKIGSKSKSRPKSSNPSNSVKVNSVPPKTSSQKPLEDEQTTQRILYILAEYKEQVENSPDKDKPAPRRRSNPPINPPGSSKRKKSSSGSRRPGTREMSPIHCDETCRTMGSEDSSCSASQGDCNESCIDSHSPQHSPRKVVRKITFENESTQTRPLTHRNVIVSDGQTITVARGAAGKPTTAVLMPANYILPVSMVKSGQQIAIVTNRGPKLITVGGETGNAVLLQRVVGPAGLKPVLTRPGVRHVRLPAAALHNLQAFNLAATTTIQPPDSTASPGSIPTPPELIDCRAARSPWTDGEASDVKPEPESNPEESEPWNLATSSDPNDYLYEETVRTDNMNRTVLDAIPDRYSPEMEAQRIFDKMFDVETKKSYVVDSQDDSPRCDYDIDTSDGDDKPYRQVVKRKIAHRKRLTHAAALRHKYAILEQELRLQGKAFLQKSLSEECEDLGVDSPSASELFPEAELLFSNSPAQDNPNSQNAQTPLPVQQLTIPQPDIDDQAASDHLIRDADDQQDLGVTLGLDEGIVTVSEDGMQATIALDQEEFARSHPNTTFHSEPPEEGEVQPFTITGLKGRHITSTIFHAGRAPATVLVSAPQTTVISQATNDNAIQHNVKYANINHIINATHANINLPSVVVKDDRLTKFDNILTDSRELHLSNTASAVIHSTGNATQVIRRVCYDDEKRETRYILDEPEGLIAGHDAKMVAEDNSRDDTLCSIPDDDNSSSERHAELFWESNSASERSESRRPLDFSSDSEKCCKSPSYDETNSTDSSVGIHVRLDSVIKDARGLDRSGSADGSSADDTHPPLRTYPAKRIYHSHGDMERSLSGKTRACPDERSDRPDYGPERPDDCPDGRRRASGRGVVKRGCHCCSGSPQPPRPKKPRYRKPNMDFTN